MSFLANGKENVAVSAHFKTKEMPWSEPYPLEKLNWVIHLQHIRGETNVCKELIKNEIRKSNGRNEFAHFKQGVILREEGRIQEALESFQACMKLNPENTANVKEVGKCLYEMRRYRLSLEAYLEAERVSKNPDWQIYFNIGQCLLRLGESNKAKEYAQKAVQLGKHEIAYSLLIKILTSESDLRAANTVCNAAIESCPDSVSMLTESGLLYLKMGQTQFAFERLSSALALDPSSAKALLGIGCITQSYEEHDVALSKYKIAVNYEPNSVALWNNIGICFYSKQKHIAAISCLKRALWLSPTNWRVLFNLGLVHLATYQPASAFNFLCAAVNLRPDVAHSFTALGCALIELKDMENACRAFKQALLLAPDDPVIVINNVIALLTMGSKEEGLELFHKFKALLDQNRVGNKEVLAVGRHLSELLETLRPNEISEILPNNSDSTAADAGSEEDQNVENMIGSDEFPSGDLSARELEPDEV